MFQDDEDEEINEFKEQFPEVDTKAQPSGISVTEGADKDDDDDEFEGFKSSNGVAKELNLSESQAIKEWKQRRDLEIEEREKLNSKKRRKSLKKLNQLLMIFMKITIPKEITTKKKFYWNKKNSLAKEMIFEKRYLMG